MRRLTLLLAIGIGLTATLLILAVTHADQLRAAQAANATVARDLAQARSEADLLTRGVLELSRREWREPFFVGVEVLGPREVSVEWPFPQDGLYFVVSSRCVWSTGLIATLAAESRAGETVFLVGSDPSVTRQFIDSLNPGRAYRLIRPHHGWWNAGVPARVTPVWLRIEEGWRAGFGLGAPSREQKSGLAARFTVD